jgi:hypothetical protein
MTRSETVDNESKTVERLVYAMWWKETAWSVVTYLSEVIGVMATWHKRSFAHKSGSLCTRRNTSGSLGLIRQTLPLLRPPQDQYAFLARIHRLTFHYDGPVSTTHGDEGESDKYY